MNLLRVRKIFQSFVNPYVLSPRESYRLFIIGAACALVMLAFFIWWQVESKVSDARQHAYSLITSYSSSVSSSVGRRSALLQNLKVFIDEHPTDAMVASDFEEYARVLYKSADGIQIIGYAPQGVQKYVYPLEPNKMVLGINLLHSPRHGIRKYVELALSTKQATFSPPYTMLQGQFAAFLRQGVFDGDGDLRGLIIIGVEIDPILREAGVTDALEGLSLAIRDENGEVFFGNPDVFAVQPVLSKTSISGTVNGGWEIGIAPLEGWPAYVWPRVLPMSTMGVLLWLLFVVFRYREVQSNRALGDMVAVKTQELQREKDLAVKSYNQLNRLHDMAAALQKGFLPEEFVNEYVSIQHIYKPLQRLSGDTLDFTWHAGRQMLSGFVLDVSGHGLVAAMQANVVHGILNELYRKPMSLSEKIHFLNKTSLRYFDGGTYFTVLYFELDCRTAELRVVVGGNNNFLASCQHKQGRMQLPGSLVGIFPDDVEYQECTIALQPGDFFAFCSDGLFDLLRDKKLSFSDGNGLYRSLQTASEDPRRWDDASAICVTFTGGKPWPLHFSLLTAMELPHLRERLRHILRRYGGGYADALEVALNEALNNAILHAGETQTAAVTIKLNLLGDSFIIRVKQAGGGFAANGVLRMITTDTFAKIVQQDSGRGLPLIKALMDRVLYNRTGTEILMVKHMKKTTKNTINPR